MEQVKDEACLEVEDVTEMLGLVKMVDLVEEKEEVKEVVKDEKNKAGQKCPAKKNKKEVNYA